MLTKDIFNDMYIYNRKDTEMMEEMFSYILKGKGSKNLKYYQDEECVEIFNKSLRRMQGVGGEEPPYLQSNEELMAKEYYVKNFQENFKSNQYENLQDITKAMLLELIRFKWYHEQAFIEFNEFKKSTIK